MIDCYASGLGITAGKQDASVVQKRGRGEAKPVQFCAFNRNEYAWIGIIDFRLFCPTCNQHPAILELNHRLGQFETFFVQPGTGGKSAICISFGSVSHIDCHQPTSNGGTKPDSACALRGGHSLKATSTWLSAILSLDPYHLIFQPWRFTGKREHCRQLTTLWQHTHPRLMRLKIVPVDRKGRSIRS
jgi:hypothetical protein